jgi:hypothetical protein
MADMGEVFNAMKAHKQAQHSQWKEKNTEILLRSRHTLTIKSGGEAILFRESGKPKVDFYPSTGRWRVPGSFKTFRGGAESFLSWYERQEG